MYSFFQNLKSQIDIDANYKKLFPDLDNFVENHFLTYGADFLERLRQYGTTEKGEKLIIYPWIEEYASLIGDLRIDHIATAGNAQCGKSLINTLLMVDFLIFTGLNSLWFYPTKQQVDALVPEMFGKVVRGYIEKIETGFMQRTGKQLNLIKSSDRQLASRFQVKNATAIFSYTSNSARDTPTKSGLATVGTSAASVSASILFIDERSQISPEASSVLPRRLDATRLPKQVIRDVGTFGAGYGIETVLENSQYHFYPHFTCDSCGVESALNPKGCLLLERNGKFLSQTGRPINWSYKDKNKKIESAFFCCPNCGEDIPTTKRSSAYFICLKTGIKLKDFLNNLPKTIDECVTQKHTVFLHLSPLLRITRYNLAANLIQVGLQSESTKDYQQQVLGFSSESDVDRITKEMIIASNSKLKPVSQPDYILAGIDQGRSEDYFVICKYWVPPIETGFSEIQQIEESVREIVYCKPVLRTDIPAILKKFKVDFGLIDNEPDRLSSFNLTQQTCLKTADQRNLKTIYKQIQVSTGGIELESFAIDNVYFLDLCLSVFANGKIKTDFEATDKTIYAPARHFTSVSKDDLGVWNRAKDKIDDLFYAYMFCEAAFYIWHKQIRDEYANSVQWYLNL